jgi:hypothetical protein
MTIIGFSRLPLFSPYYDVAAESLFRNRVREESPATHKVQPNLRTMRLRRPALAA